MQLGDKEARIAKKWESAQLGLSSSTASKFWAEATSSHWTQISRKLQQSWIWPRGDVIYLLAVLLCSSLWSTQRTLEVLKDLQKLFQEGLLLEVCGGFHVYVCRVCVCVTDFLPVGLSTVFTKDVNVKKWVPDVPQEYFHLPGPEEKLDFLRLIDISKR